MSRWPEYLGVSLLLVLAACSSRHLAEGHHNSPAYSAGFTDGCNTATTRNTGAIEGQERDEAMYKTNRDYRSGWKGGYASCRVNNPNSPLENPFGRPPGS